MSTLCLKICVSYFFLMSVATGLPDTFKEFVSCYGNTFNELIQPACTFGSVIAVRDMFATSKLKSTNCPQSITAGLSYDPSCCLIDTSVPDCKLEFDKTKRNPYLECTGKIECSVGTDWQQMVHTCGSLYLENSNIQSMEYNCIQSSSILKFNQVASQKQLGETYISNNGFPTKLTSSSEGTCYVTSCYPGLVVGLIDLRLSESGGACGQKLTITDGSATTDLSCSRNNQLKWTQMYTSTTSSIYIKLTPTSVTPDAFVWIDVSGINLDVYCGVTDSFISPTGPVCTTTTETTGAGTSTTTATATATAQAGTKTAAPGQGTGQTGSEEKVQLSHVALGLVVTAIVINAFVLGCMCYCMYTKLKARTHHQPQSQHQPQQQSQHQPQQQLQHQPQQHQQSHQQPNDQAPHTGRRLPPLNLNSPSQNPVKTEAGTYQLSLSPSTVTLTNENLDERQKRKKKKKPRKERTNEESQEENETSPPRVEE